MRTWVGTYLQRVIQIGTGVCQARVHHLREVFVFGNLVVDTDWRRGGRWRLLVMALNGNRIIQWNITGDGGVVIDHILDWGTSGPYDD